MFRPSEQPASLAPEFGSSAADGEQALAASIQAEFGALLRTLLYEGYSLFPYRRAALKNQYRWNFGVLSPPAASSDGPTSTSFLQAEIVLTPPRAATPNPPELAEAAWGTLGVCVVFLQQTLDGRVEEHWIGRRLPFSSLAATNVCALSESPIRAELELASRVAPGADDCRILTLTVRNLETLAASELPSDRFQARTQLLARSLLAAHLLLILDEARAVSATAPPERLRAAVASSVNLHTWPALLDPSGKATLWSPIIVGDLPELAAASPGHSFDSTEIDELAQLATQSLSDSEQRALLADADPRTTELLTRSAALPLEAQGALHASQLHAPRAPAAFQPGDRVRLYPRRGGDVWDVVLSGKHATIVGVDWDFEGHCHLSVSVDDDPGADLGKAYAMAHRFFFSADEVRRV